MLVPSFVAIGASAVNCGGPLHLALFVHIEIVCLAESTAAPRLKPKSLISPPLKGMIGSAVPAISSTGIGRAGWHPVASSVGMYPDTVAIAAIWLASVHPTY